jgi:hypothetical protein
MDIELLLKKLSNKNEGVIMDSPKSTQEKVEDCQAIIDLANNIIKSINRCWEFIKGLRCHTCNTVSYKDLIAEIVTSRPDDPRIEACGVVKRDISDKCIELTVVYLDEQNEPLWGDDPEKPYGYRKRTKKLEPELGEKFQSVDMLLIK